jgi:hypothetical protein
METEFNIFASAKPLTAEAPPMETEFNIFASAKPLTAEDKARLMASPLRRGLTALFDKTGKFDFRNMSPGDLKLFCTADSELMRRYIAMGAPPWVSLAKLLRPEYEAELCECVDMTQEELDDLFGTNGTNDRCYLALHMKKIPFLSLFGMKPNNSKHMTCVAEGREKRSSCGMFGGRSHPEFKIPPRSRKSRGKPLNGKPKEPTRAKAAPGSAIGICPKVGSSDWTQDGIVTQEVALACFKPQTVAMTRFKELLEAKGTVSIEDMFQGSVAFMHDGHRYVDLKMPCRDISIFLFGYYDNHMGEGSRGIRESANGWRIKRVPDSIV